MDRLLVQHIERVINSPCFAWDLLEFQHQKFYNLILKLKVACPWKPSVPRKQESCPHPTAFAKHSAEGKWGWQSGRWRSTQSSWWAMERGWSGLVWPELQKPTFSDESPLWTPKDTILGPKFKPIITEFRENMIFYPKHPISSGPCLKPPRNLEQACPVSVQRWGRQGLTIHSAGQSEARSGAFEQWACGRKCCF